MTIQNEEVTMFRRHSKAAPELGPVLMRAYDTSRVKSMGIKLEAMTGIDDRAIGSILAIAEYEANELRGQGYVPVSHAWAGGMTLMKGPMLTVLYVRKQDEASA